jgi:protein-S-isoprenylcysteine O-methyltransferase Ste14
LTNWTLIFIGGCWLAWALYWLAMAFANKRTVERGNFIGYRVVALLIIAACVLVGQLFHVSSRTVLWHTPLALGILTDLIVVAGALLTIWARVTLGGNWSAEVTFKQDHELIESGPYALVRHPIYTGLITMGLGAAINYGRPYGFVLVAGLCGSFWWKARQEEGVMGKHFPDAYREYKARVRAIVPFVL